VATGAGAQFASQIAMMHQSESLSDRTSAGLGRTFLMTLALGTLLLVSWRRVSSTRDRLNSSLPHQLRKLPRRLQTWEGEGGRPTDSDDHEPQVHPEPLPHIAGSETASQR
jgi:hypothetical protein